MPAAICALCEAARKNGRRLTPGLDWRSMLRHYLVRPPGERILIH